MGTIIPTAISAGTNEITETTLTSSDTFVYAADKRQVLILNNVTAGALTVNIDGDGASSVKVPGVGLVDISAGYSTGELAAGDVVAIPLDSIKAYLTGTIAVTGGTGIAASLLSF